MAGMTRKELKQFIRDSLADMAGLADHVEQSMEEGERAEAEANRKHAHNFFNAPAANDDQEAANEDRVDRSKSGSVFGGVVVALAKGNGDLDKAHSYAEKIGDAKVAKALAASTIADGGALLGEEISSELIPLLDAKAVVRGAGPQSLPLPAGGLAIPYESSGPTAAYIGENVAQNASQPSLGMLHLNPKKLQVTVPVSNELLRGGGARAEMWVRNSAVRKMAVREDLAFLRGLGTDGTPKGMRYWVDSANTFAANSTLNLDNVTADTVKMLRLVKDADVTVTKGAWFMSPRSEAYLLQVRDSNGNLVFAPEMRSSGKFMGFPYYLSTQIPDNLGGGSNESEVTFANMDSLLLADSEEMIVKVFPGGAYKDSSGTMQSGISNDQTVLQVISQHDFGASFRGKEIAVLSAVNWI